LNRDVVVTEKIDGTNASVYIDTSNGTFLTGSRTRWITPEADNFGFAKWAHDHRDELLQLGDGHHFGEWWGSGIQRNYGLDHKKFSLFNVGRWKTVCSEAEGLEPAPGCCGVVPTLWQGTFAHFMFQLDDILDTLRDEGSVAAPGFMKPEGIVVYHTAARTTFKVTLEKDEQPKGAALGGAK
jgi:hypothetical protein